MAYEIARGLLSEDIATEPDQIILIPIPQDGAVYDLVVRLGGTFVGTVQLQDDQSGSFVEIATTEIATTTAAAGSPTAVGTYAASVVAGAKNARILFTAFTSGEVNVQAVLIPLGVI